MNGIKLLMSIFLGLLFLHNGYAQVPTAKDSSVLAMQDTTMKKQVDEDKIFTMVEVAASFPGGDVGWKKFLGSNLNGLVPVDNGAPKGIYTVIAKFVVRKDGSLSNLVIERDPGFGMGREVLRVIKKVPDWKPALQNGRPVNAYRRQPVTFVVDGN